MVLMLFREYEFCLRTASSCLLLKYINSVFVFHLQLQQHHQQSELHTSFFAFLKSHNNFILSVTSNLCLTSLDC